MYVVFSDCSHIEVKSHDLSIFFFFQTSNKLMEENKNLNKRLQASEDRNKLLRSQMEMIRKTTLTSIIEQMDQLKMPRHTEV